MVDILNCQKGCIRGTATDESIDDIDVELAINEMNKLVVNEAKPAKKDKCNPWNSALSLEKRWEYFSEQFRNLDIADFSRSYTDKNVKVRVPNEQEMNAIFTDMGKITKEDRKMGSGKWLICVIASILCNGGIGILSRMQQIHFNEKCAYIKLLNYSFFNDQFDSNLINLI